MTINGNYQKIFYLNIIRLYCRLILPCIKDINIISFNATKN